MGWVTLIRLFLKAVFENFGTLLSLTISLVTWFKRKKIAEEKLKADAKINQQLTIEENKEYSTADKISLDKLNNSYKLDEKQNVD